MLQLHLPENFQNFRTTSNHSNSFLIIIIIIFKVEKTRGGGGRGHTKFHTAIFIYEFESTGELEQQAGFS
jgi:hypothetical protein